MESPATYLESCFYYGTNAFSLIVVVVIIKASSSVMELSSNTRYPCLDPKPNPYLLFLFLCSKGNKQFHNEYKQIESAISEPSKVGIKERQRSPKSKKQSRSVTTESKKKEKQTNRKRSSRLKLSIQNSIKYSLD